MRHHQIRTIFGNSFVPESHETTPAPRKDRSFGPLAMLLVAALVGATIPAVAITANSRFRTAEAARWKAYPQPTYYLRVPATVGFDQSLF